MNLRIRKYAAPVSFLLLTAGGFIPDWRHGLIFCLIAAAIIFAADSNVYKAGSWKLWIVPALFFVLLSVLGSDPDRSFLGVRYQSLRLFQGIKLLVHAYVFFLLTVFVSSAYSGAEIIGAAERIGLKSLGLKITLALIIMRNLKEMFRETCYYYALPRPTIQARLKDGNVLIYAIIRNAAITAESVSALLYLRSVRIS